MPFLGFLFMLYRSKMAKKRKSKSKSKSMHKYSPAVYNWDTGKHPLMQSIYEIENGTTSVPNWSVSALTTSVPSTSTPLLVTSLQKEEDTAEEIAPLTDLLEKVVLSAQIHGLILLQCSESKLADTPKEEFIKLNAILDRILYGRKNEPKQTSLFSWFRQDAQRVSEMPGILAQLEEEGFQKKEDLQLLYKKLDLVLTQLQIFSENHCTAPPVTFKVSSSFSAQLLKIIEGAAAGIKDCIKILLWLPRYASKFMGKKSCAMLLLALIIVYQMNPTVLPKDVRTSLQNVIDTTPELKQVVDNQLQTKPQSMNEMKIGINQALVTMPSSPIAPIPYSQVATIRSPFELKQPSKSYLGVDIEPDNNTTFPSLYNNFYQPVNVTSSDNDGLAFGISLDSIRDLQTNNATSGGDGGGPGGGAGGIAIPLNVTSIPDSQPYNTTSGGGGGGGGGPGGAGGITIPLNVTSIPEPIRPLSVQLSSPSNYGNDGGGDGPGGGAAPPRLAQNITNIASTMDDFMSDPTFLARFDASTRVAPGRNNRSRPSKALVISKTISNPTSQSIPVAENQQNNAVVTQFINSSRDFSNKPPSPTEEHVVLLPDIPLPIISTENIISFAGQQLMLGGPGPYDVLQIGSPPFNQIVKIPGQRAQYMSNTLAPHTPLTSIDAVIGAWSQQSLLGGVEQVLQIGSPPFNQIRTLPGQRAGDVNDGVLIPRTQVSPIIGAVSHQRLLGGTQQLLQIGTPPFNQIITLPGQRVEHVNDGVLIPRTPASPIIGAVSQVLQIGALPFNQMKATVPVAADENNVLTPIIPVIESPITVIEKHDVLLPGIPLPIISTENIIPITGQQQQLMLGGPGPYDVLQIGSPPFNQIVKIPGQRAQYVSNTLAPHTPLTSIDAIIGAWSQQRLLGGVDQVLQIGSPPFNQIRTLPGQHAEDVNDAVLIPRTQASPIIGAVSHQRLLGGTQQLLQIGAPPFNQIITLPGQRVEHVNDVLFPRTPASPIIGAVSQVLQIGAHPFNQMKATVPVAPDENNVLTPIKPIIDSPTVNQLINSSRFFKQGPPVRSKPRDDTKSVIVSSPNVTSIPIQPFERVLQPDTLKQNDFLQGIPETEVFPDIPIYETESNPNPEESIRAQNAFKRINELTAGYRSFFNSPLLPNQLKKAYIKAYVEQNPRAAEETLQKYWNMFVAMPNEWEAYSPQELKDYVIPAENNKYGTTAGKVDKAIAAPAKTGGGGLLSGIFGIFGGGEKAKPLEPVPEERTFYPTTATATPVYDAQPNKEPEKSLQVRTVYRELENKTYDITSPDILNMGFGEAEMLKVVKTGFKIAYLKAYNKDPSTAHEVLQWDYNDINIYNMLGDEHGYFDKANKPYMKQIEKIDTAAAREAKGRGDVTGIELLAKKGIEALKDPTTLKVVLEVASEIEYMMQQKKTIE
jgi:hypothetical protein